MNEKYMPKETRREHIRTAYKTTNRKIASDKLRTEAKTQVERKLENFRQVNIKARHSYEHRCSLFDMWRKVQRITSEPLMTSKLAEADVAQPNKEYSLPVKIKIVRQQIQLRKQYDGVKKMGSLVLGNHSKPTDPKGEDLLGRLLRDFACICQHERANGVPQPAKPALVKPRDAVMGGTSFANVLMEEQRKRAADFTREFYATHVAGAFEAFKMTRTRYQPTSHHPPTSLPSRTPAVNITPPPKTHETDDWLLLASGCQKP